MSGARSKITLPWPLDDFLTKKGRVASAFDERRQFVRMYYRTEAVLNIDGSLHAFPRTNETLTIYVSDIGRGNVGLLVDRPFYPEERLMLELPTIGRKQICVRRCRHLADGCYELGAEFQA